MQKYPVLLPVDLSKDNEEFAHLNLHNGTVWRWNRLVLGRNEDQSSHFRIEHRSTSAGPTIIDSVANLVFFIGLTHALSLEAEPIENSMSYPLVEKNFYKAARQGLQSTLNWSHGRPVKTKELILQELIPKVKWSLLELGFESSEITIYLDDIIAERVRTEQTGARWQREYVRKHGANLAQLTGAYIEHQNLGQPVHTWPI